MNIKPSASIRNNYNEISALCKSTGEPVYLTKNGEGDLVVMDIEAFSRREKMLKLREELLAAEEDRLNGAQGYTPQEVAAAMRQAIREAKNGMDEKVYDVEIRPRAMQMLVEQAAFLAEFNDEAAERLVQMFEESAASLSLFPKRAPELNDAYLPPHKYRKLLFAEHYLMVYQVAERKVFVDFIVDCRQDYQWLIR